MRNAPGVHGEHGIPVFSVHGLAGSPPDDAGVVHQGVDPSKLAENPVYDRLYIALRGDIAAPEYHGAGMLVLERLAPFLGEVAGDDKVAVFNESLDDGLADSRRTSGYYRNWPTHLGTSSLPSMLPEYEVRIVVMSGGQDTLSV